MVSPARRGTGALIAVAALAFAVGCTGGDDSGPAPANSLQSTDDAKPGGVLRIGVPKPPSLDPGALSAGSHTDLLVADLLYDGLTTLGPDGKAQPAVAASWKGSADHKTWRFRIADGRTFGGKRAITSSDVKKSIERIAKLGDASFTAARLDVIDGYLGLVTGKAKGLRGITTDGKRVVVFKLRRVMATFPELLSSPLYGITARGAFGKSAQGVPVPSSLFSVSRSDATGFALTRQQGSPGFVEGVEVTYFDDAVAAYAAFRADNVDWAPVPPDRVDEADDDATATVTPFQAELFLGMNVRRAPFDDREFRRAVAAAIDRDAIVKASYPGSATPLGVIVPQGVPGHDPERCKVFCQPDVAEAKKFLKRAYPKGKPPTVLVDVDNSDTQKRMAAIVVANLKKVGIPAKARPHKFDAYKKFAVSGKQQLFSFGWIGLYSMPDAYLTPLFTKGGPDNVTGAANEAITELLIDANKARKASTRMRLWARAEQTILTTAYLVPIAQFQTLVVTDDKVKNLVTRIDGSFDITKVWLD